MKTKVKQQNEFQSKMNQSLNQLQLSFFQPTNGLTEEQIFFSIDRYNIAKRKIDQLGLNINQITILEDWTSKSVDLTLFDSNVDNWNDSSVLNKRIIGKKHVLFLIEDDEEEKFGYYFKGIIQPESGDNNSSEKNSFEFNIQSSNKRLKKPMKCKIKDCSFGIELFSKDNTYNFLIRLGDIYLKNNGVTGNCCQQDDSHFNYCGIPNILCGKTLSDGGCFNLKRLIVVEMK